MTGPKNTRSLHWGTAARGVGSTKSRLTEHGIPTSEVLDMTAGSQPTPRVYRGFNREAELLLALPPDDSAPFAALVIEADRAGRKRLPRHGTMSAYVHHDCRCVECVAARRMKGQRQAARRRERAVA